jgi:hypothetical protein
MSRKEPTVVDLKRTTRIAGLLALMLIPAVGAATDSADPAKHLRNPEYLSAETRSELDARMTRHGQSMSNLVRAVVLLDRPTIRVLANRIADEEVVARAERSVHQPRSLMLPREFYLEQTKLAVAARDLAVAANEGGDDRALAERFAAVTSTCVGCHSAYLHGRPSPEPFGRDHGTSAQKKP